MWQLKNINAQNICAFRSMDYCPLQGKTTLVFGNNKDNDAQGSNGSGKSALIEALSLALTGDTLRKVNADEIINDACDEASVTCYLVNQALNRSMTVERQFSRRNPQSVSVVVDGEAVVLSSVTEYNKYVLSQLGLTKDDIFSSFILSKHKYASFLDASDRIKKELINRFSNGSLVDESISHLKTDCALLTEQKSGLQQEAARLTGRLSAIDEQIQIVKEKHQLKVDRKGEMIEAHQEAIAKQRAIIREQQTAIREIELTKDGILAVDKALEELECSAKGVSDCYDEAIALMRTNKIPTRTIKNYREQGVLQSSRVSTHEANIERIKGEMAVCESNIRTISANHAALSEELEVLEQTNAVLASKLKSEMESICMAYSELNQECMELSSQSAKLQGKIASLKAMMGSAIECPNCQYRFVLQSEYSLDELNEQLVSSERACRKLTKKEELNAAELKTNQAAAKQCKQKMYDLDEAQNALADRLHSVASELDKAKRSLSQVRGQVTSEQYLLDSAMSKLNNLRLALFDDVFSIIDAANRELDADIQARDIAVQSAQLKAQSYQQAIEDLINMEETADTAQLDASRLTTLSQLNDVQLQIDEVAQAADVLMVQEARFVDFKTHLANSKIEALANLTNEYMSEFGTDIRIAFSGYTVLKNGKIRDRISISLLRDGVDCGSFGKFSAGEQCRANLASILALHQLSNANCEDGKGLDLLVLDEILEATDEAGLASMFEALNNLKITSLVVSHGQVAEAYPHRLTITKQNGISTIND